MGKKSRVLHIIAGLLVGVVLAVLLAPSPKPKRVLLPQSFAPVNSGVGDTMNSNPTFNTAAGWGAPTNSVYDASVTSSAGSGSWRMNGLDSHIEMTSAITVTPGADYTITANLRQDVFPGATSTFKGHPGIIELSLLNPVSYIPDQASVVGASLPGRWTPTQITVTIPSGVTSIKVQMHRHAGNNTFSPTTPVWIDDIRVLPGVRTVGTRATKRGMDGAFYRTDNLGNWQYKDVSTGVWTDWVPFCMHGWVQPSYNRWNDNTYPVGDSRRGNGIVDAGELNPILPPTASYLSTSGYVTSGFHSAARFTALKTQGFDCSSWGVSTTDMSVLNTAGAVGFRSFMQVSPLIGVTSFGVTGNMVWLRSVIDAVNGAAQSRMFAGYYWDNENNHESQHHAQAMWNEIRSYDVDPASGKRRRPVQQLNGSTAGAPPWSDINGNQMSDVIGSYVGSNGSLLITDNIPGVDIPSSFCQLSGWMGNILPAYVFSCLAQGARSFAFFSDGPASVSLPFVEDAGFWADLPLVKSQMASMAPLIQATQYPGWVATQSGVSQRSPVTIGERSSGGFGYLILSNTSFSAQTRTITLTDLGYAVTGVRDYFSNSLISGAVNSGTSITVTVPAGGVAGGGRLVVKLDGAGGVTSTSSGGTTTTTIPPTSTNVAPIASAFSPISTAPQTADKVNDNVIDGYPGDSTKEWSAYGAVAGTTYVQLTWSSPQTINKITLYDRPNTSDNITSGTLLFSDGSTVAVSALDSAGAAQEFSFAAKTVTSARFTLGTFTGSSPGLAEMQAWTAPPPTTTTTAPPVTTGVPPTTVLPPSTTAIPSGTFDDSGTAFVYSPESAPGTETAGWAEYGPFLSSASSDYLSGNHTTSAAGVVATFTVNVSAPAGQVDLYGAKGPAYGKFAVNIDGTGVATVDLYESTFSPRQTLTWTSPTLLPGSHTITFTSLGPFAKNAAATDSNVVIDKAILRSVPAPSTTTSSTTTTIPASPCSTATLPSGHESAAGWYIATWGTATNVTSCGTGYNRRNTVTSPQNNGIDFYRTALAAGTRVVRFRIRAVGTATVQVWARTGATIIAGPTDLSLTTTWQTIELNFSTGSTLDTELIAMAITAGTSVYEIEDVSIGASVPASTTTTTSAPTTTLAPTSGKPQVIPLWTPLSDTATVDARMTKVRAGDVVVLNPSSGPYPDNPAEQAAVNDIVTRIRAKKAVAMGYVDLLAGTKDLKVALDETAAWANLYGVVTVFYDHVPADFSSRNVGYLWGAVRGYNGTGTSPIVVLNTAGGILADVIPARTLVITYAGTKAGLPGRAWQPWEIAWMWSGSNAVQVLGPKWQWVTTDSPPNPYDG